MALRPRPLAAVLPPPLLPLLLPLLLVAVFTASPVHAGSCFGKQVLNGTNASSVFTITDGGGTYAERMVCEWLILGKWLSYVDAVFAFRVGCRVGSSFDLLFGCAASFAACNVLDNNIDKVLPRDFVDRYA
jgi:hypothetical protein